MSPHPKHSHKTSAVNVLMRSSLELSTRVLMGSGAIDSTSKILKQERAGRRVLIITQPALRDNWAGRVFETLSTSYVPYLLELPDGEGCKSHNALDRIWSTLQELQFSRIDSIVAVGGGAICDIAGFAASTYLRGLKLFLVPTTLLAQVDAAIGGKTAINLASGKNLAGTIYFPSCSIVDSQTLSTLSARDFKSGLGEIIKYGFLEKTIETETEYRSGPRSFLSVVENVLSDQDAVYAPNIFDGIIASSIRMKLAVVAKDPYEDRLRRCLNLGHTLAHAIEKVSAYSVSHGEAVSLGMIFACRVSLNRGLFAQADLERLLKLMSKIGMPIELPSSLVRDELWESINFDKKRVGAGIKFVLPLSPVGLVDVDSTVNLEELKELLSE